MSAPFTPGPWRFDGCDNDAGDGIVAWVTSPSGAPIADIQIGVGLGVAESNARLIALAPFMHAVLTDIALHCARLAADPSPLAIEFTRIYNACHGVLRISPPAPNVA